MAFVLIVEDNELNASLIKEMFFSFGWQMGVAKSYAQAFRLLNEQRQPVDLILMDFVLPDGNGIDLAKEIKKVKKYKKIPMILISGYSFSSQQKKELKELFVNILEKPLDRIILLTLLKRYKKTATQK